MTSYSSRTQRLSSLLMASNGSNADQSLASAARYAACQTRKPAKLAANCLAWGVTTYPSPFQARAYVKTSRCAFADQPCARSRLLVRGSKRSLMLLLCKHAPPTYNIPAGPSRHHNTCFSNVMILTYASPKMRPFARVCIWDDAGKINYPTCHQSSDVLEEMTSNPCHINFIPSTRGGDCSLGYGP